MNPENGMKKLQDLRAAQSAKAPDVLTQLFDPDSFTELDGYTANDGVVIGYGYVEGCPVYAFAQTGPVGMLHAKKLNKIYQMAQTNGCPVIGFYNSNGGYISEGYELLAAYGEMLHAANRLSGVVPQISVVTGTCAGSAAVLAASADFVIMTEAGEFFLTPPFTAAAKGAGAPDAGTAAAAAKSGAVHLTVADDQAAVEKAKQLLCLLPTNNLAPAPICEFSDAAAAPASGDMADIAASLADSGSILVLQEEYAPAAYTALATLGGQTVGLIGAQGELNGDAAAKIARFVSFLDAFNLAAVTLVDTEGFLPSAAAEAAGSVREAARLAHVYAEATCPKLTVLTGKAYGAAFITLAGKNAGADMTFSWPDAVISALPPITAAEFLHHDQLAGAENVAAKRQELADTYAATEASPFTVAEGGYIDDIITPEETRGALIRALDLLSGKRVTNLPKKHGSIYC